MIDTKRFPSVLKPYPGSINIMAVRRPSNITAKPHQEKAIRALLLDKREKHFSHPMFSGARMERLLSPLGGELLIEDYMTTDLLRTALNRVGYQAEVWLMKRRAQMVTLEIDSNCPIDWLHWPDAADILMQGLPKTVSVRRSEELARKGGQTICPSYIVAHSLSQELTALGYTCRIDESKISL